MRNALLLTAAMCLWALPALAQQPPGDTTVTQIKLAPVFPTDIPLQEVNGQYELLANQLQLVHANAEFRQDPVTRTLYAAVPGVRPLALVHRSDCSINSGFTTVPLLTQSAAPMIQRIASFYADNTDPALAAKPNRSIEVYRPVLVMWTKSRHGIPDKPIPYRWTAAVADVTLDQKQLEAFRTAMRNPPASFVARN